MSLDPFVRYITKDNFKDYNGFVQEESHRITGNTLNSEVIVETPERTTELFFRMRPDQREFYPETSRIRGFHDSGISVIAEGKLFSVLLTIGHEEGHAKMPHTSGLEGEVQAIKNEMLWFNVLAPQVRRGSFYQFDTNFFAYMKGKYGNELHETALEALKQRVPH